ncbi:MAG: M14 family zinc carboxypeptidase [Flavobacteriaceae bacterium]
MKNILLLTLLIFSFSFLQAQQEKFHRAKIEYQNPENLKTLDQLGVAIDHGFHKKGHFIISDFSDAEISAARSAGLQVTILTEDIQKVYVEQNIKTSTHYKAPLNTNCESDDYITPSNYSAGSMGGFFTYDEVLQHLDAMRAQFPNLISERENLSTFLTFENRSLQWLKITKDPENTNNRPQVLYTAIHHAREPASLSQLIFYMWYLLENYETDDEIKNIVDNTELYFIPVVNPDGYIRNQNTNPNGGGLWRKNRRNHGNGTFGVDNNRNYDYWIDGDPTQSVWNTTGTSGSTNGQTYAGSGPFSEPENQAVRFFVENHNFVVALNAHTHGELLLYPYGYENNVPTPDNNLYENISELMVAKSGYSNIISAELYPASGDSDDFMYGQTFNHDKIFAFTPEIGPSFWPPSNSIIGINKEMLFTNITAARLTSNFAELKDTSPEFVGAEVSFDASFSLKRLGLSGDGSFTVSINPISNNIATVGAPVSFSGLELLESQTGSIPLSLFPGTSSGDLIAYELVINNGSFDEKQLVIKIFGGLTPVFEDLGNSVTDNFSNNGWDTTVQTFVSPSSSITESPNGNYGDNQNKTITLSEPVDLTEALGANVTFFAKWDIEKSWDYTQFEISTDGGSTWIPQCGKFTSSGSSNNSQPTGEPLYDGTQIEWVEEEINLSEYLGETIIARFQFASDGAVSRDGFYFDDLTFNVLDETILSTPAQEISKFSVYPNPAKTIVNINSGLDNYALKLLTVQGQVLMTNTSLSGHQTLDLSSYSKGMYFLVLKSSEISETFKLIKN